MQLSRLSATESRARAFGPCGWPRDAPHPPHRSSFVYAVVSVETEKAVELFVRREDAEKFLGEVQADDEELAALLRLEPVELDA